MPEDFVSPIDPVMAQKVVRAIEKGRAAATSRKVSQCAWQTIFALLQHKDSRIALQTAVTILEMQGEIQESAKQVRRRKHQTKKDHMRIDNLIERIKIKE